MRFFLVLLANAMLFIRPSEFIAELNAVELYRYIIAICLLVSFPLVLRQFTTRYPGVPPIAGIVLAMFPAVILSGMMHGDSMLMIDTTIEFFKIVVYFLLLLCMVDSVERLRRFLYWIGIFSAAVTMIAVLRYHVDIELPTAPKKQYDPANKSVADRGTYVVDQVRDPMTGELVDVKRMCGTGIFNDPNDLALVLVTAIPMCLYWLTDPKRKTMKPFWIALLFLFGYALMLTHSRGGFLALLAGIGALLHMRFGGKRTLVLAAVCLPLMFVVFAGRMTSISSGDGTGQSRIQLWAEGLQFFQQSPLFGIGADNYRTMSRHVAHNSFIHSYAELGLFGGTLFIAAFYFAFRGLHLSKQMQDNKTESAETDLELRRLLPYLTAVIVAYTVGIAFLSRCYIVPTYMILGLATVYLRLHATQQEIKLPSWSGFLLPRLAGLSICFLVGAHVFIRMFVVW
jgi:hypothetical protein